VSTIHSLQHTFELQKAYTEGFGLGRARGIHEGFKKGCEQGRFIDVLDSKRVERIMELNNSSNRRWMEGEELVEILTRNYWMIQSTEVTQRTFASRGTKRILGVTVSDRLLGKVL
jgi:hypothetical protein